MTPASTPSLPAQWATAWAENGDVVSLEVLGDGALRAGELASRTGAAARSLASKGVKAGDRVVWEATSSIDAIVVALGVVRLGAVLVPVSERQSDLERGVVIEDVEPTLVIAEPRPQQRMSTLRSTELLESTERDVELDRALGDDVALIIYTSGTTGSPKGVMHTHRSLSAQSASLHAAWGWTAADLLMIALPLFHVHGLVVGLFAGLAAGGGVVCQPVFDPTAFLDAIRERAATMAFFVPTMLHRLAVHPNVEILSSLRLVVSGSAPLATSTFNAFESRGISILERYGMTETLLTVSNPLDGERRAGTVGHALPGVRLRLPPPGEDGELLVAGPSVFAGYWRQPSATAAIMNEGWVATGDIVRVDRDGYLVVCGRTKELIISGGFNVYPTEIEEVLRTFDGIDDVAVVGLPSEEWGEVVAAYVVVDGEFDHGRLEEFCAARLSPYKRPRRYFHVEAIPRNSLGKVQRHLL